MEGTADADGPALAFGSQTRTTSPGVICVRVLQRAWLVQSATLEYQKEAKDRVCLHSKNPVVMLKGGQSQIRKCRGDCVQCDRLCCLRRRRATLKW